MTAQDYTPTRRACYFCYLAMSSVFSLPPMLFITFHEMYGISYTLLGSLVVVNFCTQLGIDLIFSFFPRNFNIRRTIRLMPLLTSTGLLVYALMPMLMPDRAVVWLVIGTVLFSVAAGLSEVLLSPLVASLPSEHPDRDMSLLHSLYGWGTVSVVLISSLYFRIFGTHNWNYLALFWAVLPLIASILFQLSPIPDISIVPPAGNKANGRAGRILLCVLCIFFGSCAENAMTNWISGFMENALHIPKTAGDVMGMAVFAFLLTLGRMMYAKWGKNILNTLTVGMAAAVVCYLIAGGAGNVIVSFIACILTGFATSMLWPGTLILLEEKVPGAGVSVYALMAAGGDFGASVAPQMLGILVDKVAASGFAREMSATYGITAEQIGLKCGMISAAVFPLLGVMLLLIARRYMSGKPQPIVAEKV